MDNLKVKIYYVYAFVEVIEYASRAGMPERLVIGLLSLWGLLGLLKKLGSLVFRQEARK